MKSTIFTPKARYAFAIATCLLSFTSVQEAAAQQNSTHPGTSAEEITRKLNNPVASLISVPFQSNLDVGIGENKGSRYVMNFQPVLPFRLTNDVNLIARVIVPFVSQQNVLAPGTRQTGISDVLASAFFSPANPHDGFIWGAGPAFLLPTATNDFLGNKKWGVGPTAVGLKQTANWTIGTLVSQVWSYAGNDDRSKVSQFYIQPFITHNWKSGAGLGVSSEITRNWEASTTTAVIIPTVTGVTRLGTQAVQLAIGPRIPVHYPDGRKPDYGIRGTLTFVFPKTSH